VARAPDGERPGIWLVGLLTGAIEQLVDGKILYDLRLLPDGRRLGYVRALSEDSCLDRLWIVDLLSGASWRLLVAAGHGLATPSGSSRTARRTRPTGWPCSMLVLVSSGAL
jgi:hypothetical protein